MDKYICRTCGFRLEIELEKTNNGDMNCPICKSSMLNEEEFKSREEIQKAIEEDRQDDNMNPRQDALDDVIDTEIIEKMKENIFIFGNEECFNSIEKMVDPYIRYAYRNYFLK